MIITMIATGLSSDAIGCSDHGLCVYVAVNSGSSCIDTEIIFLLRLSYCTNPHSATHHTITQHYNMQHIYTISLIDDMLLDNEIR
jgi:hypothetical protein